MAKTFKQEVSSFMGLLLSRLLGGRGCEFAGAGETISVPVTYFIAQEATAMTAITGSDGVDYLVRYNISGNSLAIGALITAPAGITFTTVTVNTGSIIGYV